MTKDGRSRGKKKMTGDKDGPRRVVLYLSQPLAKRVLVRCAERDLSITDAGAEAFERWLLVTS